MKFITELPTALRVGFFLASRQLKRANKWTTVLIVFIMMLTFMNLVVVNGILVGLLTGSYKQFQQYYSGDVLITPAKKREIIDGSQALISKLENNPDVKSFSPRIVVSGHIQADLIQNTPSKLKPNESGGSIVGIDPNKEELVTNLSTLIIEGEPLRSGEEGFIVIGANRLQQYSSFADVDIPGLELLQGVSAGSKVRLTVSTENEKGEPIKVVKDLIVKGVLKSKVDDVSQKFFMVDTELRKMVKDSELNVREIAVNAQEGREEELLASTRAVVDLNKVRVQSSIEAIPSFLRDIEATFAIIGNVIGGIALVVASITIFIVIFINAVTKRKYIGILKGIGIKAGVIEFAYVLQALFYGIAGTVIGSVIVFGFLKPYLDKNPLDFPFSDGILDANFEGTLTRVGILLLITLVAGFLPARIIVKKNTLDSILGR